MTHEQLLAISLMPAAYLAGSVPFGLLVGLARGVDVRKAGSGNIGATNVARLLGARYFALVFALDVLKGLLPTLAAGRVLGRGGPELQPMDFLLWLLVAAAAIAGHMFSIFLGFRGGKGVATGAGAALGVYPYFTAPALVALLAFIVVFLVWRYVSLGSIAAAVALPVAYVLIGLAMGWPITGRQLPLLVFAILIGGLVIARHRANISRLLAGTEPRAGRSA